MPSSFPSTSAETSPTWAYRSDVGSTLARLRSARTVISPEPRSIWLLASSKPPTTARSSSHRQSATYCWADQLISAIVASIASKASTILGICLRSASEVVSAVGHAALTRQILYQAELDVRRAHPCRGAQTTRG